MFCSGKYDRLNMQKGKEDALLWIYIYTPSALEANSRDLQLPVVSAIKTNKDFYLSGKNVCITTLLPYCIIKR